MKFIQRWIKKWVDESAIQVCDLPDEEWASSLPNIYSLDPAKHIMLMFKTSVFMVRSIWIRMPDDRFVCLGRMAWGFCGRSFEYGVMTLSRHRIEFGRTSGNTSEWRLDGNILLGSTCVKKVRLRTFCFPVATPFQIAYPNVRKGVLRPPSEVLFTLGASRKPLLGFIELDDQTSVKFKFYSRTDGVFDGPDSYDFNELLRQPPTLRSTPTFSNESDLRNFSVEEKIFLIGLALWPRIFYPFSRGPYKDEKIEL